MKFFTQGSINTLGDFFISTHVMYNLHKQGYEVHVALLENPGEATTDLYNRTKFFTSKITLKNWDEFVPYAEEHSYTPHFYLRSLLFEKEIKFYNLKHWFDLSGCDKTVTFENYAIIQVTSSTNYNRPVVPFLNKWVLHIKDAGVTPVFIGTKKDEELFKSSYPELTAEYQESDCWRFGKDSLWQSIGNVLGASSALVFSSWSSIVSSLCGIYTIEMWNHDQVLYYPSVIKYYLGSPVSLIQIPFTYDPIFNYFSDQVKKEMDLRSSVWLK